MVSLVNIMRGSSLGVVKAFETLVDSGSWFGCEQMCLFV